MDNAMVFEELQGGFISQGRRSFFNEYRFK